MRWSNITRLVALSLATLTIASPSPKGQVARAEAKEETFDSKAVEKDAFGRPLKPSTFNGQEVPVLQDIDGEKLDSLIGKSYWFVEFFSPYCHHCKAFAPTLQTLYELYYTSSPISPTEDTDASSSLNSFTRYYDFHFGRVDCVAFGSACQAHEVGSFPTVMIFKDGKMLKKSVGSKTLKDMSEWLEEVLESIKPGSRPKRGLKLPKDGADHVEGYEATSGKSKSDDPAKGAAAGLKQNEIQDELEAEVDKGKKTSSSKSKPKTKKPKPKAEINPAGRSVALTAENFQSKVTTTRDPWFIKFYTKWCPHCQALAPTWHSMARDMQGKLNIGEVDCEAEKRLCKDVHVQGYPTLIYFQGGERIEYSGLRGLGDLLNFANKAVSAGEGVKDVTAAEFEELEKDEEVIFVYLYDHATTSEDFEALERLLLSLIGRARLVKSKDEKLYKRFKVSTWPRLLVSRDGKPSYYTPLSPRDMRDFRKVLGWMKGVWQPIVAELTAANAKEIMANKLVVLGILSRDRADEFIIAKREIKNAALEWIDKQTQAFQLERQELRDAKQLRIEEAEDRNDQRALRNAKSIRINMEDIERKEVAFAWVDGVFWERWIKTTYGISVKDGERVVVNDEENHRYWDTTITGNPIVPSRTSILETLPKIVASPPKISPKSTASFFGHIYYTLRQSFLSHPFLSSGALVILLLLVTLSLRGSRGRGVQLGHHAVQGGVNGGLPGAGEKERKGWGTGGFFQLPMNGGGKEGLGGLLGGNGGGEKAD
ncbi:hypothetical protein KVT40_002347 [Elsinoe batatas]|uniref:Thioredoxin domain-containing protein n=1 Tax=Elsinoe batatas TaxID=2601811 RepID=A0A8K0LEH5_9PEZI|nr:hypothetical protein KVT40_002347 [Elsinoe batatas]